MSQPLVRCQFNPDLHLLDDECQTVTVDLDRSGDPEYDRLTSRLEARLLARGDGRSVEESEWLRYRIGRRMEQPAVPDDVDKLAQRLRGAT